MSGDPAGEGADRDSSLVAYLYDERNDAVKILLRSLIHAADESGVGDQRYGNQAGQAKNKTQPG